MDASGEGATTWSRAEVAALVEQLRSRVPGDTVEVGAPSTDHHLDVDEYWRTVHRLRRTAPIEIDQLAELLDSDDAFERRFAADVLAQYGFPHGQPFLDRSVAALLARGATETDPAALEAIVAALGWQKDRRVLEGMVAHADHPDADVREAVAAGLAGMIEVSLATRLEIIVPTLGRLVRDPDAGVRDWAAFSLAHEPVDGHDIREVLAALVGDDDEGVRGEAILGLARRHDRRALPLVTAGIQTAATTDDVEYRIIDAAALLADEALFEPLVALQLRSPPTYPLDRAVERCDPQRQAARQQTLEAFARTLEATGIEGAALYEDTIDADGFGDVLVSIGSTIWDLCALLDRHDGSVPAAAAELAELTEVAARDHAG